jgi:hypothetical protein
MLSLMPVDPSWALLPSHRLLDVPQRARGVSARENALKRPRHNL